MSNTVAAAQLRQFVVRVERLQEEQKALGDDIKEVFAEAKANGYCTKTLRAVIRLRKMETHTRQEQDALLDTYREALGIGNSEHYRRPRVPVDASPTPLEQTVRDAALEVAIEPEAKQDGALTAAQRLMSSGAEIKLAPRQQGKSALNDAIAAKLEEAGYTRDPERPNVFRPPEKAEDPEPPFDNGPFEQPSAFPPAPTFDDPPAMTASEVAEAETDQDETDDDERPMWMRMREAMLKGENPANVE